MIRFSLLAVAALGIVLTVTYCSSLAIPRGVVIINIALSK